MTKDTWNPEQYDKFKAERSQPFYDLMNMLEFTSGQRIVDLGCGTGELTAELHQSMRARQTTGFDSSEQMLLKAKAFESKDLTFLKGDIESWRHAGSFDVIFSNAAIQWCRDHEQIFKNLRDSLSENGQLAVQMPMNHDYPTHETAFAMAKEPRWKAKLGEVDESNLLKAEEYASLLFKLGFKEQKVLVRVYSHQLDSREGVIEWVKGTLLTKYKSRLSDEDYKAFVTEFKTRLFKVLPDEKPFFYPFKRILIWGKI